MSELEKPVNKASIIGCGDIGCRVAKRWLAKFTRGQLTGYARSTQTLQQIASIGIGSKALDLDNIHKTTLTEFAQQVVFYFAPPPLTGTTDPRMRAWLAALDKQCLPTRILYISTTGVYGNHHGARINEQTTANPQTDRANRRLDAETSLTAFAVKNHIEFIILRVSGIYGQNRLPVTRLKNQTPILEPALSPITNRIHEDDLAKICIAAALHPKSGEIYNVSDGDNMTMSDYFITVAEHLKLAMPPTINWQQAEQNLSTGMLSYLKESRLIDNSKMLSKLDIKLKYQSIKDFFIYTSS